RLRPGLLATAHVDRDRDPWYATATMAACLRTGWRTRASAAATTAAPGAAATVGWPHCLRQFLFLLLILPLLLVNGLVPERDLRLAACLEAFRHHLLRLLSGGVVRVLDRDLVIEGDALGYILELARLKRLDDRAVL